MFPCTPFTLSDRQRDIWLWRAHGMSYGDIKAEMMRRYQIRLCNDEAVARSLKATALGYYWKPSTVGGCYPYLCTDDEFKLSGIIEESCAGMDSIPIWVLINQAHQTRIERTEQARTWLYRINCLKLASSIEDPLEPDRTWVN